MGSNPYEELLRPHRLRQSTRGAVSAVEESESDRARVLYSAAFRRLQRKTQVFPLEENAAVRSRLTHSLEVAHVGRYLATRVIEKLRSKGIDFEAEDDLAFANIVDTACLLHDLGNPPFGHFGEAAISAWFADWSARRGAGGNSRLSEDLRFFDGNPQGFRIATSIGGIDKFGLNLTCAQIASTVKYPVLPDGVRENDSLSKKAGIFWTEGEIWGEVREKLRLPEGGRFPLAYLMEAADDISYCLSDIEDGIEKGYTTYRDFHEAVERELEDGKLSVEFYTRIRSRAEQYKDSVDPVVFLRTQLVRDLVGLASDVFVRDHDAVLAGTRAGLLDGNDHEACVLLTAIKGVVRKKLYGKRASVEIELGGQAAIRGILCRLEGLLALERTDFERLVVSDTASKKFSEESRLRSLLPDKYVRAYVRNSQHSADSDEIFHRAHLMVDYVAGMTDVFAMSIHRKLGGIKFQ